MGSVFEKADTFKIIMCILYSGTITFFIVLFHTSVAATENDTDGKTIILCYCKSRKMLMYHKLLKSPMSNSVVSEMFRGASVVQW